jgi:hypothetical protein
MVTTFIFFLIMMILIFVLTSLKKKTPAFQEWAAVKKKIPLFLFFNEDNTVDWVFKKPEAGIIMHDKYGAFIVNPQANYLDKITNNIFVPCSTSVGCSIPANFAQIADSLGKVIGDERKLSILRKRIMENKVTSIEMQKVHFLRETINFSKVKSMLNNISPHSIDAKIKLMVSRQLGGFGQEQTKMLIAFLLIGLGLIALFAFVYQGKTGNPQVSVQMVDTAGRVIMQNATRVLS